MLRKIHFSTRHRPGVVYLLGLNAQWLLNQGGLPAIAETNAAKAKIIYDLIDNNDFYSRHRGKRGPFLDEYHVHHAERRSGQTLPRSEYRGRDDQPQRDIALSVGLRASVYNAMTLENVRILASFMNDFAAKHG